MGVTETCMTRREVTELTKTREMTRIGERLHGVEEKDGVKDAHTHTQVARDNGGELAERVGTRCEQLGSLPREKGEGVCPREAGHGQVSSVVPREVEGGECCGRVHAELGGYEGPGSSCSGENPRRECPGVCGEECCPQCECPRVCGCECGPGVCGVAVRVYQRV